MWDDFGSLLCNLHRSRRRFRTGEGRRAGAGDRDGLHHRLGRLAVAWILAHAGRVRVRTDPAVRSRYTAAVWAHDHCDSGEPLVADSRCGMPVGGRSGSREQGTSSGNGSDGLCTADDDLVLADGRAARARHLGASAAAGAGDYRSRLEAFLRAAAIAEPAASANSLGERFTTLSELLSAGPAVLADYAGGEAADALTTARALMLWAAGESLRARQPVRNGRETRAFLKMLIGFRSDEALVVIFLDSRRYLIDHEIVATGSADAVEFDQRRILLRAMGRGAVGIIVAHNHPSGDPAPSSQDIALTRRLAEVARELGICLHDHLVVAGGEVRSAMFAG